MCGVLESILMPSLGQAKGLGIEMHEKGAPRGALLFVPPRISVGWFSFNFCATSPMLFGFLKLSVTRFQVCSDSFCYHLICSQSPFSVTEIQRRKDDAFLPPTGESPRKCLGPQKVMVPLQVGEFHE